MSDVAIRTYQPDDLPALAVLLDEPLDRLRWRWAAPDFQPETDCWVAVTPVNRIVGVCFFTLKERESRGWGSLWVHPDYQGQGIGMRLLAAAEAGLLVRRPDAAELPILFHLGENDFRAANLLLKRGYEPVRQPFSMRIELNERHDSPMELPAGVVLRDFDAECDWRAVYAADRAAFAANWGFDLITPEEWRHEHMARPDFEARLWLLAYAGETLAGLCLNYPGDGIVGHLDTMGVHADWRRRGLGAALVRLSLHEFRRRGFMPLFAWAWTRGIRQLSGCTGVWVCAWSGAARSTGKCCRKGSCPGICPPNL
ncbi:MAG: GNAT family N-acetyltransferase [Anaerolineaceae bacterium]|nr:GNAT family N-acetyltransferase [Anaerolineaceae bacterium]